MSLVSEGLTKESIVTYLDNQLLNFFPDGKSSKDILNKNIDESLDRMMFSLKHVKLGGYTNFNILHSDLYAQFIYYVSNTVWKNDSDKLTASKLFYLNKALHGLNCMYDTELPDIFLLIHCVGSVLGKATYGDYFVACHNITVGSDRGYSPVIEKGVYMGPGSSIIGKSLVRSFTHLAINSVILHTDTTEQSVAVGAQDTLSFKPMKRNLIKEIYFSINEETKTP
jgi:serine O-acetyltransferase